MKELFEYLVKALVIVALIVLAAGLVASLAVGFLSLLAGLTQVVAESLFHHPLPFWPLVAGWFLFCLVLGLLQRATR